MGMYPKMVVFCHEAVTGLWKVWVDNCTSALGCSARRLPCLVSVWTAWHTTSSKWGIFLEVSSLYVFIFTFFLKSFGHGFGHNCNKVLGVNFQCPCNIFFFFVCFVLLLLLILHSLAYFSAPQLTGLSESVFLTWLILENPQEPRAFFFFFFQKNTLEPPLSRFSLLSWVVYCFLTVLQFVAQNVFNASQGVRDIGFLSWTPLTIFPPQVSCVKEGT